MHNYTRVLSLSRTQHIYVRRMRSSIVSMIQSVLEFRFMHVHHTHIFTGDSSYISGIISSPFFHAKNTFVTAYLLESSLARFKKCRVLFSKYFLFVSFEKGNRLISSAACLFSTLWKRTKSSQMYSTKTLVLWIDLIENIYRWSREDILSCCVISCPCMLMEYCQKEKKT